MGINRSRQIQEQLNEARSENARLNEEVDFGRAIQELLTTENTELKTNCQERLEQAMQPLQQRIREYEEEHLNSEEIINNLLADHVLLQDNNRELTNEVDRLREELESIRDVQRLLEEENAELRRQPVSVSQSRVTHLQLESSQESWMKPESEVIIGDCETGRGSYGEIRVGTYHGAKVAVKKIHGILDDDQTRTEFEREILFNTLCRHPCIVQFAGVANPRGNNPLVIMELLDRSLRDLRNLDEKSFEVYQILQIAKDISAALCYLHSFKPDAIIHRDVSAGNILLWRSFGSMWRGKLADFGSATFDNDEKFACPGAPFYSAPEAAYPEQHSTKMDIFSLGVCVLEMYAGNFQDSSANGKRTQVNARVRNSEMRKLILDCFAEEPNLRPSADHIICVLQLVQES